MGMDIKRECWRISFFIPNGEYLCMSKHYDIDRVEESDETSALIDAATKCYYKDFLKRNGLSDPPEVLVLPRVEKMTLIKRT